MTSKEFSDHGLKTVKDILERLLSNVCNDIDQPGELEDANCEKKELNLQRQEIGPGSTAVVGSNIGSKPKEISPTPASGDSRDNTASRNNHKITIETPSDFLIKPATSCLAPPNQSQLHLFPQNDPLTALDIVPPDLYQCEESLGEELDNVPEFPNAADHFENLDDSESDVTILTAAGRKKVGLCGSVFEMLTIQIILIRTENMAQ